MPLWFRVMRIWLPIAVAATVAIGLTYVAVQQSYRNGLDDPQLQLATDGAAQLDADASPESVASTPVVDIGKSLDPFVIVLTGQNEILATGAKLGDTDPQPPDGVLAVARANGSNRVTWEPRPGVRIASVTAAARDGRVVVAGRNMRAVEARIDDLGKLTAIAWALAMVGALIATGFVEWVGLRFEPRA